METKSMGFDWFHGSPVKEGRRLAYDIETNGLLPDVDTIHSLVLQDIDTDEVWSCCDRQGYTSIGDGLKMLEDASVVFGHNIIGYDGPVLEHLFPNWKRPKQIDTLTLAKMIWPVDSSSWTSLVGAEKNFQET